MGQDGVPERRVALAVAPRSPCESARPERNAQDGVTPLTAGTQVDPRQAGPSRRSVGRDGRNEVDGGDADRERTSATAPALVASNDRTVI
jgi:hypothetical protein